MPTAILLASPLQPGMVAPLLVGGITVLERQTRQVRRAGFTPIVVDGHSLDAASLDGDVLVVDAGVVLDDRIVGAMAAATAPAVATWPGARGTERIDLRDNSAGIALYPAALVRETVATLGEWDFGATLLRASLAAGAKRVDLSASPLFDTGLDRAVPLVWARPDDADGAAVATAALVAAAQPGCRDAVERWLHGPIEDVIVRLLLPLPVPADVVALAVGAITVAAGVAFATGWLWTALVLALTCGPLAGIAAKLARVRVEQARIDSAVVDLAPYGWFVAVAAHFAATGMPGAWPISALLTGFMLADRVQHGFFRRLTSPPLAAAGAFERRSGLIAARRDTLLWTWLGFAAFGFWYAGFVVLATYATVSFFVAQWRTFKRLAARP
jgi:hypothetical protein